MTPVVKAAGGRVPDGFVRQLENRAQQAGFEELAIVRAGDFPGQHEALARFVATGHHGDMKWLQDHQERRAHPSGLWPQVRSVIMLGMNYGPAHNPLDDLQDRTAGNISVFARGKDYHAIINRRLRQVAGWLHRELGADVKIFVDTAPVMEKALAASAGIGWRGKHSNIVSRRFGSWLFLGAIFTTAELPPGTGQKDHCGTCRRCLDICPTRAFVAPYRLDARRCISYLTIEYKGHIATELRAMMGNHVFGCDDCLAICPWNRFARQASEARFHPRSVCDNPPLATILKLDEAGFRERFKGTPVKRAGRDCLLRNALIASGNSGDVALAGDIVPLLGDRAAVVRAMAVWALAQLLPPFEMAQLRKKALDEETDSQVICEWDRAEMMGEQ